MTTGPTPAFVVARVPGTDGVRAAVFVPDGAPWAALSVLIETAASRRERQRHRLAERAVRVVRFREWGSVRGLMPGFLGRSIVDASGIGARYSPPGPRLFAVGGASRAGRSRSFST